MSCAKCRRQVHPGREFVRFFDPKVLAGRSWRWSADRVLTECGDCVG